MYMARAHIYVHMYLYKYIQYLYIQETTKCMVLEERKFRRTQIPFPKETV